MKNLIKRLKAMNGLKNYVETRFTFNEKGELVRHHRKAGSNKFVSKVVKGIHRKD